VLRPSLTGGSSGASAVCTSLPGRAAVACGTLQVLAAAGLQREGVAGHVVAVEQVGQRQPGAGGHQGRQADGGDQRAAGQVQVVEGGGQGPQGP